MVNTIILGLSLLANTAQAEEPAKGALELMAGNETATLDTKLSVPLNEKFKVSTRTRVTSGYERDVHLFGLLKLDYNIVDGLDIVGGVMGTSVDGFDPQIGTQYLEKFGDFGVYQIGLVSIEQEPEMMSLTNLSYTPKLNEDFGFVANFENVTFFGFDGHHFSTQRLRLGGSYQRLRAGFAFDLVETDSLGYNIGGFVGANFK